MTKPTSPARGSGVELRRLGGVNDAEAVRAEESDSSVTAEFEQPALELAPLGARFGEPRRDHDQRRDAPIRALGRDLYYGRRGHCDHCEVDLVGHFGNARIGAHRLNHLACRVDRIDGAIEPGLEQVVEDLAADCPAAARRPDHGHRPGCEKAADRRLCRELVPALEALHGLRREGCRHLDADRAAARGDLDREATLAKHLDHPAVLAQHLGEEERYSVLLGNLGEMSEQERREPASLHLVGDGEGDLRYVPRATDVDPLADHPAVPATQGDQPETTHVVNVDHLTRGRRQVGRG